MHDDGLQNLGTNVFLKTETYLVPSRTLTMELFFEGAKDTYEEYFLLVTLFSNTEKLQKTKNVWQVFTISSSQYPLF